MYATDLVTNKQGQNNSSRFHTNTMKCEPFLLILHYFHFTDSDKENDMSNENNARVWKIREIFNMPSVACSKFYSLS
jgi:hypothetical protein